MLTRKQLEDAAKCGYIHCVNCSCAPICEGVETKSAQTALALAEALKQAREALEKVQWIDNYNGDGTQHCKCCSGTPFRGHSKDCAIKRTILAIEVLGGWEDV